MKHSASAATESRYIVYFNWTKNADEAELVNSSVRVYDWSKVHAMQIHRSECAAVSESEREQKA